MLLTLSSRKRCHVILCRLPKRRRRQRISITAGEESERNLRQDIKKQNVLKEGEHKQAINRPHMFALFEDDIASSTGPQASPSAAQPAVMDIRRLWRRFLEKIILHSSLFPLHSSLISLVLLVIFNCGVNVFLHRLCAERSACASINLGLLCQLLGFRELKVVVERQQKLLDA